MKSDPNLEIFRRVFSSRIEVAAALEGALKPSQPEIELLKVACLNFEAVLSELDKGAVEDQYRAYCTAVSIFTPLAEWKHSVRNAVQDSQRFLSSAKLRSSEIDPSLSFAANERLVIFLEKIECLKEVGELTTIQRYLKCWSLPLLLFSNLRHRNGQGLRVPNLNGSSKKLEKLESTVAFLKFDIDGEPAKNWNYLKPGTAYDLTVEVRVSHWPKGAGALSLRPVTIDVREQSWLPSFKFNEPKGGGPFSLTGTGRAVLEVAQSFGSRPYEFLYAAEFDDMSKCLDVAVVGHRRLLLEGVDVVSDPLSGFSSVDRHLLSIRNRLRAYPGLNSDDLSNAMIVLGGLGNIAGQALKDATFEVGTSERAFQKKSTEILRSRSDIGEGLQGHLEAAGGITDLTFRNIPIELKVEHRKTLFPKDFSNFFNQTALYAIGLGKRIGILSVLDVSPKSTPVGIIEDDIQVFDHQVGHSSVVIVVVVVRGGFPKPSSYSR
ncbi:hypothetical protein HKK55_09395 [Pseudomonas sp. ADAK18]|uniref:hypothetical protein n=1 Tax=Pseudomonas sp. ADAK18 TaxID=2730848 RepID=UPI001462A3A9|nr:hypothetical protein [Pseudomonas sp. ADAK18]QJI28920.1 hypothetical protein HKK55_09395 [Pseudomonas sp. ADAK18]